MLLGTPGNGPWVSESVAGGSIITGVNIFPSRLEINTNHGPPQYFSLRDLSPEAQFGSYWLMSNARIKLNNQWHLKFLPTEKNSTIRYIADALYVLKRSTPAVPSDDDNARFAEVVRAYREAAVKPVLSEDARKFMVQAEGAVRDKDLEDAAALYAKALAIAPWWPEGHFNRALLLGEIGDFEVAIAEMKRYVQLAPDAPDARAAQDKMYEWERKAK